MLWYSSEAPRRDASNKYPQLMFSWRNKKSIMWIPLLSVAMAHTKSYHNTATSKDSDHPVHPPSMTRVFSFIPFLDSLEAIESTCDQRRLYSDCADAQTDLSLRYSHKSYCRFRRALAHYSIYQLIMWSDCERADLPGLYTFRLISFPHSSKFLPFTVGPFSDWYWYSRS